MSAFRPIFGLGCALLVTKADGRQRVAHVATVTHYYGLLFKQPSELRYGKLIRHIDLKRRDRDAPALQRG
jgi:hypothetical protein